MKTFIARTLRRLAQRIDPVPKSEITNCYIYKRPSDGFLMDFRDDGTNVITLRGYTIAPTEIVGTPPYDIPSSPNDPPIIRVGWSE